MTTIRFRFDPEKTVQALAYFASRGVGELTAMKSAKLLYFADKRHLLKYGRPILGDSYFCMENGPIPSTSLDIINSILDEGKELEFDLIAEYFAVEQGSSGRPELVAKKKPDTDVFSISDLEILDQIIEEFGHLSAWELRNRVHEEEDVRIADAELQSSGRARVHMPFRMFFEGAEDDSLLEMVEADQENRDFAESLTW